MSGKFFARLAVAGVLFAAAVPFAHTQDADGAPGGGK
jgi:hypothetical protein